MPKKAEDLSGIKFGRLLVLGRRGNHASSGAAIFLCRCDCGAETFVTASKLRSSHTRSCGCLFVDEGGNYKHGGTGTTEHDIWRAMIERCRNPKFKDYAGRGISVCQRWLDSFEDFLADMGHRPSSGHSIERERNEENYEPGNCVWATAKQQGRNKRNNILVEYAGRTMVLSEAAEVAGINYKRAWWRINAGWGVQRALTP